MEGSRIFASIESRPAVPDASFETSDTRSSLERFVAQGWKNLNEMLEAFQEQAAEDTINPEGFMVETMDAWKTFHERSEYLDLSSSFERIHFLLGLVVEKAAEWTAHKKAAVRRVLFGFAKQSLEAMNLNEQGILNRAILRSGEGVEIGNPRESEQRLIDAWLRDTIGQGVR